MHVATANLVRFERAVFTSTGSNSVRGYHLVARTEGIDDDTAQVLCQWSPTHDGLCDSSVDANSLNYFAIDDRLFAISKSVIGGAEYSGRSALQTVTTILVGQREDLPVFHNNPLAAARVALSMGWLRLIVDYESPLAIADVSTHGLPEMRSIPGANDMVERAVKALSAGERIAITSDANHARTLAHIFEQLPAELRPRTSFSTGIKASTFRPFQIQFFSHIDNRLRDFLCQQRIVILKSSASD